MQRRIGGSRAPTRGLAREEQRGNPISRQDLVSVNLAAWQLPGSTSHCAAKSRIPGGFPLMAEMSLQPCRSGPSRIVRSVSVSWVPHFYPQAKKNVGRGMQSGIGGSRTPTDGLARESSAAIPSPGKEHRTWRLSPFSQQRNHEA